MSLLLACSLLLTSSLFGQVRSNEVDRKKGQDGAPAAKRRERENERKENKRKEKKQMTSHLWLINFSISFFFLPVLSHRPLSLTL